MADPTLVSTQSVLSTGVTYQLTDILTYTPGDPAWVMVRVSFQETPDFTFFGTTPIDSLGTNYYGYDMLYPSGPYVGPSVYGDFFSGSLIVNSAGTLFGYFGASQYIDPNRPELGFTGFNFSHIWSFTFAPPDDTTVLSITSLDAVKVEGNNETTPFTFIVTRSGDVSGVTTVEYNVAGSGSFPADTTDFGGALPSGTLTFNANATSKTISIDVASDLVAESDESFTVTLSNASDSATIRTPTAEGTIQNDDFNIVHLSIFNVSTMEGTGHDTTLKFHVVATNIQTDGSIQISLNGATNPSVRGINPQTDLLQYFNSSIGTQDINIDPFQIVTLSATNPESDFVVTVHGDSLIEPNEKIAIQGITSGNSTGQPVIWDKSTAIGIIADDDGTAIPANVKITFGGQLDNVLKDYVTQDILAATQRIEKELGFSLPEFQVSVHLGPLSKPEFQAQARPVTDEHITVRGVDIAVPNVLWNFREHADPNGEGADIIIGLDPNLLTQFYSGHNDTDMSGVLTHELLHGLGVGAGALGDPLLEETVWDVLTMERSIKGFDTWVFIGAEARALAKQMDFKYGWLLSPDGHHLAEVDLMDPTYNGPNDPISEADVAVLHDMGYSLGAPSWWPQKLFAHLGPSDDFFLA